MQTSPLPGFETALSLEQDAIAEHRGRVLTRNLLSPLKNVDKATSYIENHKPLFAGTDASHTRRLFTHDDPTF